MNRKQLLMLIGGLAVICLCVAGIGTLGVVYMGRSFSQAIGNADDPASVQKVAGQIADYSAPEGYKQIAMDLIIYKYVMLMPDPAGSASGPFMMMMAYPANSNLSDKQMQEQMQRSFSQQTGQNVPMSVVETKTISIRGQDKDVTVLEGEAKGGSRLRQWVTIFKGKNGPVLLMIQGEIETWDDSMVTTFVESIK